MTTTTTRTCQLVFYFVVKLEHFPLRSLILYTLFFRFILLHNSTGPTGIGELNVYMYN